MAQNCCFCHCLHISDTIYQVIVTKLEQIFRMDNIWTKKFEKVKVTRIMTYLTKKKGFRPCLYSRGLLSQLIAKKLPHMLCMDNIMDKFENGHNWVNVIRVTARFTTFFFKYVTASKHLYTESIQTCTDMFMVNTFDKL